MLKQLLSKLVLPTLEQVRCVLMISTCAHSFSSSGWVGVVLYPSFVKLTFALETVQFLYILSHHIYSHTHTLSVHYFFVRWRSIYLNHSISLYLSHPSLLNYLYDESTYRIIYYSLGSITYRRSWGSQDGQHDELLCTIRVWVPTEGPHGIEWCVREYG
jgi:hypothetical protein